MAETKTIELKVKTDMAGAISGVDKLKTGLKETTKNSTDLNNTLQGSKQSEFINKIGDGVGKLNPAFGSAVKGANGLILKMWEMVANPIGAILAGIVITAKFLYEAFQSSVAGGKELKTIFAGISAVGAQVKDAIFGLGRALINVTTAAYKFITLDFKGAAEDMKKANGEATESWKQLGNAVDGTTFKIVKNLEKQQQINDKARKLQAVTQSETNKLLVQSREILTDETASIKEKKKALEEVTKAEKESSAEKVRIAAKDLEIAKAKAKAMGGEAEKKAKQELRELTIALNEAETENAMTGIKLNKQRKMLNRQEAADAKELSDAKKEASKEAHESSKALLEEDLKNEKLNFEQKRELINSNKLITKKEKQKLLDEVNKEEKKLVDEHNKAIDDLNKKYDDERLNRLAVTAVQKEELDYQRRLAEINSIAKTETEKNTLIEKLNVEHLSKMTEAKKTDAEKAAADAKAIKDKQTKDKEDADKIETELEQKKNEVIAKSKENLNNIMQGLEAAGVSKSKAGQAIMKTLALTQIGIDTAVAIGNASKLATIEGTKAAAVGGPGAGTVARIVSYASTYAQVLSNLVKAKAMLSSGSAGGGAAGGGGGAPSGAAAPQFNVVGQGGANQIAESMANRQSQPLKAYVVGQDVTTSQSLNRSIVNNATLG